MPNITVNEYEDPEMLELTAMFLQDMAAITRRNNEEFAANNPNCELNPSGGRVFSDPVGGGEAPLPSTAEVSTNVATLSTVTSTLAPTAAGDPTILDLTADNDPVDDSGRVWDERIDSSAKTKNLDGTWKARRKVDAATREMVLAEIAPQPVVPTATDAPPAIDPATAGFTAPPAAAPVVMPVTPPPAAAPVTVQWPDVLARMVTAVTAGTLDEVKRDAFMEANGIAADPGNVSLMATRQELFAPFLEFMGI